MDFSEKRNYKSWLTWLLITVFNKPWMIQTESKWLKSAFDCRGRAFLVGVYGELSSLYETYELISLNFENFENGLLGIKLGTLILVEELYILLWAYFISSYKLSLERYFQWLSWHDWQFLENCSSGWVHRYSFWYAQSPFRFWLCGRWVLQDQHLLI